MRPNFSFSRIVAICVLLLTAGCAGMSVLTPQSVSRPASATKLSAKLVFKIPHKRAAARGARYVSPATQSATVNIQAANANTPPTTGYPVTVALTPTSTGCASTLASTVCTLSVSLAPGSYTASITMYDGASGTGNALSAATAVPVTISAGAANSIALTLGGIPASLAVAPLAPGYLRGGTGGLTLYGAGAQKLVVEALDADGDVIAGAGAPTLAVTPSVNGALTVTGPTTAAANVVTLQAATSGTPAVVTPRALQLAVTATPTSQSGAAQLTAIIPLRIAHSAVYLSLLGPGVNAVDVFYDGNVNGASPNFQITQDLNEPYGVAVDAAGTLYVANNGNSTVTEYPAGSTSSSAPSVTISNGLKYSTGAAVDAAGTLYVGNIGNGNVTEYPAGSTSTSAPGVTISSELNFPFGVAVDAAGTLYVANYGNSTVTEYPAGSTSASFPSVTISNGVSNPAGVAVDSAGTLYVGNIGNNTVTEYPAGSTSSSQPIVTIRNDINSPTVAVDAAGTLYVPQLAKVTEYPAGSTSTSSPSVTITGFPSVPQFVFAVPGPLTP